MHLLLALLAELFTALAELLAPLTELVAAGLAFGLELFEPCALFGGERGECAFAGALAGGAQLFAELRGARLLRFGELAARLAARVEQLPQLLALRLG